MLIVMTTGVPGVNFLAGSCRTPHTIARSHPRRQSTSATAVARNKNEIKRMRRMAAYLPCRCDVE
jgi:hypothetical protein